MVYLEAIKGKLIIKKIFVVICILVLSMPGFAETISDYTMVIEINPKDAEAYYNRGVIYANKGQYDLAISDFTKAIEIDPRHAGAYSDRGVIYANKGQYDEAVDDFTKALEINPKDAGAYDNRGALYLVELGNKAMGCADLQKACELGECESYNIAKQKDLLFQGDIDYDLCP